MSRVRSEAEKLELSQIRARIHQLAGVGELALPQAAVLMRKCTGLTQKEFAAIIRVTTRQVSEMESGKGNPTLATMGRYASLFGLQVGFVKGRVGHLPNV